MSTIPLPVCRWRREPTGPGRHMCVSRKLVVGRTGVPDEQCSTCRYRDHPPQSRPPGLCVHLGKHVDDKSCAPCEQKQGRPVVVPLHACDVHGRCSIVTPLPGVACCEACPEHEPRHAAPAAGDLRHLTYHLYPRGDWWRWNVQQLRQRISLFNGRRIMAVVTDQYSASLEEVQRLLADCDMEYIALDNEENLREQVSHMQLIEALEPHQGRADVTFYGHGKGVSTRALYPGVAAWTDEMYRGCLDYWPLVRRLLQDSCAAGCYRRLWCGLPHHNVKWHYSGTFRWLRNRDLYSRNWRAIGKGYCAAEGYPPTQFQLEETACVHGEFGSGGMGLYQPETWATWATAEAARFHSEHAADRQTPLLVSILLTAHAQPVRVHEAIASVLKQTSPDWQLVLIASPKMPRDAFTRYTATDPRVREFRGGENDQGYAGPRGQAAAINRAASSPVVRGDLFLHLCDDDLLHLDAVRRWLEISRAHPDQDAWYGTLERVNVNRLGQTYPVAGLGHFGVGRPSNLLRCRVDGQQVCHRRTVRTDWPEAPHLAPHADGWWIDALSAKAAIYPVDVPCGVHRFTPESCFTPTLGVRT